MRQKFLLLAMAMLGCFHVAQAEEGILTISDGTVQQGWYGCVTVNAKNFTAKTFNGFQMEVVLPKKDNGEIGLHFDKMVVDATATGYIEPEVSFNDKKGEENFGICMVFSLKDAVFKAGDFELCKIYFHADEDMPTGNYTLNIHGISMSGVDSQDHPVTDIASFNVEVTERTPRVLEDTAEEIPEPTYITTTPIEWDEDGRAIKYQETQLTEDVTVKRTIKANTWSTICLPFEMTLEEVAASIGEGTVVAGWDINQIWAGTPYTYDSANDVIDINFYELSTEYGDKIEANTPYLIKATKDISEFTVSKKQVNADEEKSAISKTIGRKTSYFNGVLKAGKVPSGSLFFSGNKFYYSTGSSKIKAFRAYMTLADKLSDKTIGSDGATNIGVLINDTPTFVEGISTKTVSNDDVYSVSGIKMGTESDLKSMQPGMYIVNGKKVIVK